MYKILAQKCVMSKILTNFICNTSGCAMILYYASLGTKTRVFSEGRYNYRFIMLLIYKCKIAQPPSSFLAASYAVYSISSYVSIYNNNEGWGESNTVQIRILRP